jgi:hypothetical protein
VLATFAEILVSDSDLEDLAERYPQLRSVLGGVPLKRLHGGEDSPAYRAAPFDASRHVRVPALIHAGVTVCHERATGPRRQRRWPSSAGGGLLAGVGQPDGFRCSRSA